MTTLNFSNFILCCKHFSVIGNTSWATLHWQYFIPNNINHTKIAQNVRSANPNSHRAPTRHRWHTFNISSGWNNTWMPTLECRNVLPSPPSINNGGPTTSQDPWKKNRRHTVNISSRRMWWTNHKLVCRRAASPPLQRRDVGQALWSWPHCWRACVWGICDRGVCDHCLPSKGGIWSFLQIMCLIRARLRKRLEEGVEDGKRYGYGECFGDRELGLLCQTHLSILKTINCLGVKLTWAF